MTLTAQSLTLRLMAVLSRCWFCRRAYNGVGGLRAPHPRRLCRRHRDKEPGLGIRQPELEPIRFAS